MADPKAEQNPVTVGFIDTTKTVSQRVPVTAANPLPTIPGTGAGSGSAGVVSTGTVTSVASLATNQTLLALNASRKGVILNNTDANDLYLKYGATATTSAGGWTYIIHAGATWEMSSPIYTGIIDGIWAADGSGVAEITEV